MFDDYSPHPGAQIASALIAVLYVGLGGATAGSLRAVRAFLYCVLPLACIWFPAAMGDRTGSGITSKSRAAFVFVFGWLVLLLPMIVLTTFWLMGIN